MIENVGKAIGGVGHAVQLSVLNEADVNMAPALSLGT